MRSTLGMSLAVPVVTAALLLSACGGGSHPSPNPTPTTPAIELSADQLNSAVLTLDDMPTGYSKSDNYTNDGNGDNASASYQGASACTALTDVLGQQSTAVDASAGAGYSSGPFGPFVVENLAAYPADHDLSADFTALKSALNSCPSISVSSSKGSVNASAKLSPLKFGSYGDETLAVQMNGQVKDLSIDFGLKAVFVRVGPNTITLLSIALGPTPLANLVLQSIAKTATDKLETAMSSAASASASDSTSPSPTA